MHKFLENQSFKPHIWEWRKIFVFDPILLCHLLFSKIRFISKSNAQHNFENSVKATFICNNGFNACVLLQTKGWGWVISLPYNFLFSFTVLNLEFGGLLCICVVLIFSFSNWMSHEGVKERFLIWTLMKIIEHYLTLLNTIEHY